MKLGIIKKILDSYDKKNIFMPLRLFDSNHHHVIELKKIYKEFKTTNPDLKRELDIDELFAIASIAFTTNPEIAICGPMAGRLYLANNINHTACSKPLLKLRDTFNYEKQISLLLLAEHHLLTFVNFSKVFLHENYFTGTAINFLTLGNILSQRTFDAIMQAERPVSMALELTKNVDLTANDNACNTPKSFSRNMR